MNFAFNCEIQTAYLDVHSWLNEFPDANGYKRLYPPNIKSEALKDVAAQFGCYFPAHYFKTLYAFSEIMGHEMLRDWLQLSTTLVILDLGCGGGAATAAIIAQLLELQDAGGLNPNMDVVCIGVDPIPSALGIYYRMINSLTECLNGRSISLEIQLIYKSIAESISEVDDRLRRVLTTCVQPAISNVILVQSNVVEPLGREHDRQLQAQKCLRHLQVPSESFAIESSFGTREARMYYQLFSHIPIDRQLMVTVGTDYEDISQLVSAMASSLTDEFSKFRPVRLANEALYRVDYVNPAGSYWHESRSIHSYYSNFYTDIMAVKNTESEGDVDWHRVIAVDNLELAWARARALLQRELLYDEIEIRLFERNLDGNLKRLHQELQSYDVNVARTSERLQYRFVKNEKEEEGRPLVLSRIEEEIVSIAIIQELGAAAFGLNARSFAYRPNPRFASRSEFLYEYWFSAFQRYKEESRNAVAKNTNCKVLSIDIKSYFTEIPQQRLVESVQKEMRTQSARIEWLLHGLLSVDLNDHCQNHGLSQGGAGSGFFANAYLTEFDSKFGINNRWEAQLFRFVDDIVIAIPDPSYLNAVKNVAFETLDDLGLRVNEEKSEDFNQDEYLNLPQDAGLMSGLSERFDDLTKPLWRTNSVVRAQLREEGSWWPTVGVYRDHLHSIGHYIEPHRLSRKLYQYAENYALEEEDGQNDLDFIVPPLRQQNWADEFTESNDKWIEKRRLLRNELIDLAQESYRELPNACDKKKRLLSTRIYFSANRLARLGYGDAAGLITEILLNQPWIIRRPQYVIRGLAIQGYKEHISQLFYHYNVTETSWSDSLMAVVIRSIRHLSEVAKPLEDGVICIAVNKESAPILRLVATETWLMKLDCQRVVDHVSTIRQIISEEQNSRVRKNYLLLLAKCDCDYTQQRDYEDPLLMRAMEVALTDNIDELFADVEPDILRERYYSTYYPSYIDFDDEVPYLG